MKVKLQVSHIMLVGEKIDNEGKWTGPLRIETWSVHANNAETLWSNIQAGRLKTEERRADRRKVHLEALVTVSGNQLPIEDQAHLRRLVEGIEFTDDPPKKEKETNAGHDNVWRWTAVCEHHGHPDLGKKVGLFATQAEAATYARACWKAWSTEPIFDAES